MLSILSELNTYGSDPESESDHHWVAIIDEATRNGYFVLTACRKCGMLAKKLNSNIWEVSRPSSDRWEIPTSLECPGRLEEIDY